MTGGPLRVVILGLSITSSWGNGHATIYRALVREMAARGHDVLFLERDVPWYAANRDLARPPYGETALYGSLEELRRRFLGRVRGADVVLVGSFVPEGVRVGGWVQAEAGGVRAFYDLDTPVTLGKLAHGDEEYLSVDLVRKYDLYLSFAGGPTLRRLRELGARRVRPFYCMVDPELYRPVEGDVRWDLGYMGTYSADRQAALEALMLEAARLWPRGRFVVAGPQYPPDLDWGANVERIEHLPPDRHPAFYGSQRYTLNVTRRAMVAAGYAPSVRLFEAAACGTPIISDYWPGLDAVFEIGREVLVSSGAVDTLRYLRDTPEIQRRALAERARGRVLREHTAARRVDAFEEYVTAVRAAAEPDEELAARAAGGTRT